MARINELYEKIATQIRTQLAEGVLPWHKPWAVDPDRQVSKPLRENAVAYQGINVLILWGATIEAGYASPFWMTYRQAQSIGAQVRRGERATHIVFAKTAKKKETDESGQEVELILPVRRVYAVFNTDQIDGLPEKYVAEVPDVNPDERDARCEAWIERLGIDIRHGGERAYYAPGPDRIQMPPFQTFESSQTYLGTVCHELIHASGHQDTSAPEVRSERHTRLRPRGTRGGTRQRLSLRGSRHRFVPQSRPRELHRLVAGTARGRAAGGVRRRDARPAGSGVPARAARRERVRSGGRVSRRARHCRRSLPAWSAPPTVKAGPLARSLTRALTAGSLRGPGSSGNRQQTIGGGQPCTQPNHPTSFSANSPSSRTAPVPAS